MNPSSDIDTLTNTFPAIGPKLPFEPANVVLLSATTVSSFAGSMNHLWPT